MFLDKVVFPHPEGPIMMMEETLDFINSSNGKFLLVIREAHKASFSIFILNIIFMIKQQFLDDIKTELKNLQDNGLYKSEYQILGQQATEIAILHNGEKKSLLNFCANNYLGLANNAHLLDVAKKSIDEK